MLYGAAATVPVPLPVRVMVSGKAGANTAVIDVFALMVTTQLVPKQLGAPSQRTMPLPAAGVAVSVTTVPASYRNVHRMPHEMPAGDDVTTPLPVVATFSVYWRTKLAVTLRAPNS